MPKILEMRAIDGALWCRVGDIDPAPDFESPVSLWTDAEAKAKYREGERDGWLAGRDAAAALTDARTLYGVSERIRSLQPPTDTSPQDPPQTRTS